MPFSLCLSLLWVGRAGVVEGERAKVHAVEEPFRPPNRLIAERECSVGSTNEMLRSGGVILI